MTKREKMLREEKIGKLLFKLSLPATIGMMVSALYNVVDTIFVGQGVGALAIGGLTVSFPIQMIIMSLSMLIGVGVAANVSISFGAGDLEEAGEYADNGYTSILIISVILTLVGYLFMDPILRMFGATDGILVYARDYMSVIFTGTIVFSLTLVNNNILRAEGNARASMLIMLIGTVLNIILDPIFIFVFDMGIRGAAAATVFSQYVSFIFVLYYMNTGKSIIKMDLRKLEIKLPYVKNILKLGFPSFVRQISNSLLAVFLNNGIVFFGGEIALSALGVINRVLMFVFLPMFGVVQGIQPIIGFNYGAKAINRVKDSIRVGIKSLVIYSTTALILVMFFSIPLFSMFTKDDKVITIGANAIKIMILGVPIVGVQIISSSLFQSIGKAKPALFLSLLRQVVLLIPLVIILPNIFNLGLTGIWMSYPIADIISTLVGAFVLKREISVLDKFRG